MSSNSIRKYGLGIWWLGLGYFVFYTPYSALTKALSSGLLPGTNGKVSGFALLPASVLATVFGMGCFITLAGWWKYAGRRKLGGLSIPFPSRWTLVSGLCIGTIIGTTTLAFTFSGISVVFVLVLLRGGVLIIGPIVDKMLNRRVRWFSWAAMTTSLAAVLIVLADVRGYTMTGAAVVNVAAYLAAYFVRFQLMTRLAKSDDRSNTLRYFVEEQMVATPVLIVTLAAFAFLGTNAAAIEMRSGFTGLLFSSTAGWAGLIGLFYAALCVCTTLIFLDRRENTFCIPMHCGSSMLSGIVAACALNLIFNQPAPGAAVVASAVLIIVALLLLSPVHHFGLTMSKLNDALARSQLVHLGLVTSFRGSNLDFAAVQRNPVETRSPVYAFGGVRPIILFVCSGNTCRSAIAEAIGKAEIAARLEVPLDELTSARLRVLSAGLTARTGAPMPKEAEITLRSLGAPVLPHAARALTNEMVRQAEKIYCMTESQRNAVLQMVPSAELKTECLDPSGDIEDPMGKGSEALLNCARRIQGLIRFRFDAIELEAHA